MSYQLKPLVARNLEAAMTLAMHYRDLNQPEEAESICRDVLEVAPIHEEAWRVLGLALTDQFRSGWSELFDEARAAFERLALEHDRLYFTGLAWERYAMAALGAGEADRALDAFERALGLFDRAQELGPANEPGPTLHYNRCVRALVKHTVLVEASAARRQRRLELGE